MKFNYIEKMIYWATWRIVCTRLSIYKTKIKKTFAFLQKRKHLSLTHRLFHRVFLLDWYIIQYGGHFLVGWLYETAQWQPTQAMRRFRANISFLSLYITYYSLFSLLLHSVVFCFVMSYVLSLFAFKNMNSNSAGGHQSSAAPCLSK